MVYTVKLVPEGHEIHIPVGRIWEYRLTAAALTPET